MLALERRNLILEKLQEEKRVVVSELSQLYSVSEETIRRDLDKLEKEGKIFVIRPSVPLTISRTSRSAEEIEKTYQVGVLDAKKQMAALKEWLDIRG